MSSQKRKSYKYLCNEREAILDEIDSWKRGCSTYSGKQRLGLWNNSTYLDELLYIKQAIEKEIIYCEIMERKKVYKKLYNQLPKDSILHIASFVDTNDTTIVYSLL